MQRYFINEKCINDNEIKIDDYNHKHMQRVMRYKNGQSVICILPSQQTFEYEIIDIENGLLKQKCEVKEDHELDVDVTLIYGLPKSDKLELVLQKATELGVKRIVPFLSKRSIIKTDQKSFDKKRERYERILKEASEQSYRQVIPELTSLATITDLSLYLSNINLVAYEETSKNGQHSALFKALNCDYHSITIVVGPEGGFEQSEIDIMKSMGIKECSLGKRILRSETAPLYMLSVIGYSRELIK
ncbi:MAG: RsmE family RNA methyltransferase [Coprobacillus sp.]